MNDLYILYRSRTRNKVKETALYYDRFNIYREGVWKTEEELNKNELNLPMMMSYEQAKKIIEKSDPDWQYEIRGYFR